MLTNHRHFQFSGQSVVEIIVAISITIIIASTAVAAVLGALSSSRLSEEESFAANFASECFEAVTSLRNQSWSNLADGTYGLSNSGGVWVFSGSSDLDPSGRFTRTAQISSVQRDANHDLVDSGGTLDQETKKVTCTVNWYYTPVRLNTVTFVSYLTNWQENKLSIFP